VATKKAAAKPPPEPKNKPVSDLEPTEEIAERTAPDAPEDDRFHHTFTLPPTTIIAEDDWAKADGAENMHNANKTALYELALHRGLHPTDEATFDGTDTRSDGSVDLHYSVACRPAHLVDHPVIETVTPTVALMDMGGDTQTED